MDEHPINVVVSDDLKRSRLTVFFRYLLAIPHMIWLYLWSIAAMFVQFINWFATLFMGRSPEGLHNFLAGYMRYSTHVTAYLNLLANPYPGFSSNDPYPVTVEIAPPEHQNRLITFFRILLAIPAMILAVILQIPLALIALIGWFVCLIMGRMPASFERVATYCIQYNVRTNAYSLLLTVRYPQLGHARGASDL